ncbi:FAD-dependent monooxygenase [Myxococcus stipitatus]|uniref:FAD-dependent monooxygenase n=1 Tax=Myxococcus stipitatus TaxID=83455 RepID=UPI0030D287CA
MPKVPVLIVGAGPTGLTLGCELARRGVACRVVDKSPELFIGSRAKGLQPRTLEVLEDMGVLDAIWAQGSPFPPFRLYSGTKLLWERSLEEMLGTAAIPPSTRTPYTRPWLIPQWRTDRILAEHFMELGGRLDLATELTGFTQDERGVQATLTHQGNSEEVRAEYLIGADGGRSFVRKTLGVSFEGETHTTERTLIGDIKATGLEGPGCHMLTHSGDVTSRFSLWSLPGTDYFQFVATVAADDVPPLTVESIQELLEQRTGRTDVRLSELRWSSLYKINVRMVARFRVGRVFLAGDAAHVHSSAGGQGLNTGIQDAYNLGWKLAAVLRGAPPSLLDSYESERLPVAARVLGLTSSLHQQNFRPPTAPAPAIHQLDITYRDSVLAVDERSAPGELRAGDRAPDARLPNGSRLFDAFRGTHFTLLSFRHVDMKVDERVRVLSVEALDGYDVPQGHFVLIRPDGYVGAITPSEITIGDSLRQMM